MNLRYIGQSILEVAAVTGCEEVLGVLNAVSAVGGTENQQIMTYPSENI
jgi:hypothetical protein